MPAPNKPLSSLLHRSLHTTLKHGRTNKSLPITSWPCPIGVLRGRMRRSSLAVQFLVLVPAISKLKELNLQMKALAASHYSEVIGFCFCSALPLGFSLVASP